LCQTSHFAPSMTSTRQSHSTNALGGSARAGALSARLIARGRYCRHGKEARTAAEVDHVERLQDCRQVATARHGRSRRRRARGNSEGGRGVQATDNEGLCGASIMKRKRPSRRPRLPERGNTVKGDFLWTVRFRGPALIGEGRAFAVRTVEHNPHVAAS
jgi:hypothetical protein